MNNINEELHVPDKENVDNLVNDIVKEIYNGSASVLYLHMPFTGNIDPGHVSVTVELKNINKYCKWIGNNNRVVCDIWFNQDRSGVVSNFDEQAKGLGIILNGDPILDIPNRIDYSCIKIVISVAKGEYNYSDLYDKIKICIRHEFAHMYKEIESPTVFETQEKTRNTEEFMRGYYNVVDALKFMNFSKKDEYRFLSMLYKCSYVEMDANISSLYQNLLNDVIKSKKLKDINSYIEYSDYKCYESLLNCNFSYLFEKYKSDIQDLYGKNIKHMDRFIYIMHNHINVVLSKMMKVYYSIKELSDTSTITESLDYNKINIEYKERFKNMIFGHGINNDINENNIFDAWLKDYMKTQYNGNIRILELLFEDDGN